MSALCTSAIRMRPAPLSTSPGGQIQSSASRTSGPNPIRRIPPSPMTAAGTADQRCGRAAYRTESTASIAQPDGEAAQECAGDGLLLGRDERGGDQEQSGEQTG